MNIFYAVSAMGLLGFFWAVILVLVDKKFQVEEDPRVEKVIESLPGVNCGACGYAGCSAFGEAIVEKDIDPVQCPVSDDENVEAIAKVMGKEAAKKEKVVARLFCRGSKSKAPTTANYEGVQTCTALDLLGGNKLCSYGCLGLADCVAICPFGALEMGKDGLPHVDLEKCTGCGKCVEACPRNLFKLVPLEQKVFIFCSSHDNTAVSRQACQAACVGCGLCTKLDPAAFKMDNFLAVVEPSQAKQVTEKHKEAAKKCPTKVIIF